MTNAQTPRPWPAWVVPVGVLALVGILIRARALACHSF